MKKLSSFLLAAALMLISTGCMVPRGGVAEGPAVDLRNEVALVAPADALWTSLPPAVSP